MNYFKSVELENAVKEMILDARQNKPLTIVEISRDIKLLESNLIDQNVKFYYKYDLGAECYLIWKKYGEKKTAQYRLILNVLPHLPDTPLLLVPTKVRIHVYSRLPLFLKALMLAYKENGYKNTEEN